MLNKDYRKLYRIQDKILLALKPVLSSFYLTGGTALGRFYLNHRFSEDLDFFMNKSDTFKSTTKNIEKVLLKEFHVLKQQSLVYDDFVQYYIEDKEGILKIEFVNDIEYRCGVPNIYQFGLIDTPLNILTNKLTAITSRDEPKDIFDIYTIARHYRFNWQDVFAEVKNKAVINEIEVEKRINSFPALLLREVDWHILTPDIDTFGKEMKTLANDLFLGLDNSIGFNQPLIQDAGVLNISSNHK